MKKIGSLFILTLCFNGYSQLNLVPNPSFEAHNYCAPAVVGNSNPGGVVLQDWHNPNTSTPDYYNACWMTPPPQNFYYQIADGDGFVGIATYNANFVNVREYVACQLLDTLQTNKLYQVSFYARHFSGRSYYASNNLGIHFSDTALHANDPYTFNMNAPSMLEAQVKYFNNEIISDSAHWTLVSGLYQADGGETWLTIGNFNKDEETAQGMEYTNGSAPGTYFVIDMVSVIPLDSLPEGIPAYAGADTTIFINDTAFIGQKISNMPSVWHKLDGTQIASNTAGVYVSPQETTTYVVSHTLNGIFSADTVTVTVIDNLGMEETEKQRIELFPIPNEGKFTIQGEFNKGETIQIFQLDGKLVYEEQITQENIEIQLHLNLNSGTYLVILSDINHQIVYRNKVVILK